MHKVCWRFNENPSLSDIARYSKWCSTEKCRCINCDRKLELSLRLADHTGSIWATVWLQEPEEKRCKYLLRELNRLRGSYREDLLWSGDEHLRAQLSRLLFRSFSFRLKAKLDVWDGQEMVRTTVDQVAGLNHVEYGYQLLDELSQ